jgi:hypothetical protein
MEKIKKTPPTPIHAKQETSNFLVNFGGHWNPSFIPYLVVGIVKACVVVSTCMCIFIYFLFESLFALVDALLSVRGFWIISEFWVNFLRLLDMATFGTVTINSAT